MILSVEEVKTHLRIQHDEEDELISRIRLQEVENREIALFSTSAKKKVNVDLIMKWMIDNL